MLINKQTKLTKCYKYKHVSLKCHSLTDTVTGVFPVVLFCMLCAFFLAASNPKYKDESVRSIHGSFFMCSLCFLPCDSKQRYVSLHFSHISSGPKFPFCV